MAARLFLLTFLVLVLCVSGSAQQSTSAGALTDKQWDEVVAALDSDDWVVAADLAAKYVKQLKEEDKDHSLARLRYIYIFASAGKVGRGAMTYKKLEAALKDLIGKEVMTPFRHINPDCETRPGAMNTWCVKDTTASSTATNRAGTYIHAFEYAELRESFDASMHKDELGALRAVVKGYQFNPNQSTIWIMRMYLEKGTIEIGQLADDRFTLH